ncbi:MAG: dephospho-CoA kinase [Chitinophagaceae bacterium]|nr:MAG: dephospho-CoA kinase [Chitinophagaceae bacterium]
MLKIGLTGGIGSGKTTVAQIFEVLGIPVYYADKEAKRLMTSNHQLKLELIKNFGAEIYENGKLKSALLASIVFKDSQKLNLLNSLVHPATLLDAREWMEKQTTPYSIKEAALIFEAGASEKLDFIIGVSAPEHIRIKRVMERDGISKEEVEKRLSNQLDENEKIKRCHFVVVNDEKELLTPQILKLHQYFLDKVLEK